MHNLNIVLVQLVLFTQYILVPEQNGSQMTCRDLGISIQKSKCSVPRKKATLPQKNWWLLDECRRSVFLLFATAYPQQLLFLETNNVSIYSILRVHSLRKKCCKRAE